MQKQKNIPQLRFPEFKDEWERKKLGEVISNKSGKFNPEKETDFTKCIELEHLATESGQLLGYIDGSNSGSIKNKFEKGDVLFGKLRPYLRKYLQAPFDGVCSSEIWVLKGTEMSNDFLYRIVQTNSFIDLANQSSGSKMPRADWGVVANGIFSFPTLPEQTRIASFFTVLDKKISELKQKKNLLEQYKKGAMQKIFSQELRFKDDKGKEFSEWEEKKLGDIASKNSSNIAANAIEENFGDYIIYGASGILKRIDFYREKDRYISIVKDGAGVGRVFLCEAKSSVLGTLDIIKPIEGSLTYLFYFLQHIDFKKFITGSTIPHIYFSNYKNEDISVPCVEEQTKIANFLSALDEKINHTTTQIQQTEHYKKGLLQKMFC